MSTRKATSGVQYERGVLSHPETPVNRREFLRLTAIVGAAAVVESCTSKPRPAAPAPTSSTPSSPPPATNSAPTPSPTADLEKLARTLQGRLIKPTDADYAVQAQLYSTRFDGVHPAAIAQCVGPKDVQQCLAFIRDTGMPLATRAGGHSYGGYSTTSGLMIDVGPMNQVQAGTKPGTARIGAGTRLADVYAKLAAQGVSIPAGSCPTVGITGLALGGGIGVVARKYGLTCDRLTAVELVTADGRAIRCDEQIEPDLFWAHRGGGGGNFGVVTALELATHKTQPLTHFVVRWDWGSAHDVLTGWQAWTPATPDELWSNLHVNGATSPSDTPQIYVSGVYVGPASSLQPLLDGLQSASKAPMTSRFVKQADYLATMMIEGGCADDTIAQCRPVSQGGKLGRETNAARSDFVAAPLSSSGIDVVLRAIENRRDANLPSGAVLFDAYGGAINRVGQRDTAFAHRDMLACLQYVAPWQPGDAAGARANQAWLDELYAAMRPHVSGFAYQNYIDPKLTDWQHAYYGVNLGRLIDIKTRYDPSDLFRFAQSVPIR